MFKLSFEEACRRYTCRYTMEHRPHWAAKRCGNGKFYAPQYRTDREWYENTAFPGEAAHPVGFGTSCYSYNQSWPLGHWLESPFRP